MYAVVHSNARGGLIALPVQPGNFQANERLVRVEAPTVIANGRSLPARTFTFPRNKCGDTWFLVDGTSEDEAIANRLSFQDVAVEVRRGACPLNAINVARRCRV